MQSKKNHTTWRLIFRRRIPYTHWPNPEGKMGRKTLNATNMTSHDKHRDTFPPPHAKDGPRHWNPGRTPSPTESRKLRNTNLESTKQSRHLFLLHNKYATLLCLPIIRFCILCRLCRLRRPCRLCSFCRLCRAHKQCKQNRPYCLEIDISSKDTLHTLTKPRGKDGTKNLERHKHDITWQTPGYLPPTPC